MTNRTLIGLTCIIVTVFGLELLVETRGENARKRAEAYCEERQMLLVETPAGERCAHVWALEPASR